MVNDEVEDGGQIIHHLSPLLYCLYFEQVGTGSLLFKLNFMLQYLSHLGRKP